MQLRSPSAEEQLEAVARHLALPDGMAKVRRLASGRCATGVRGRTLPRMEQLLPRRRLDLGAPLAVRRRVERQHVCVVRQHCLGGAHPRLRCARGCGGPAGRPRPAGRLVAAGRGRVPGRLADHEALLRSGTGCDKTLMGGGYFDYMAYAASPSCANRAQLRMAACRSAPTPMSATLEYVL